LVGGEGAGSAVNDLVIDIDPGTSIEPSRVTRTELAPLLPEHVGVGIGTGGAGATGSGTGGSGSATTTSSGPAAPTTVPTTPTTTATTGGSGGSTSTTRVMPSRCASLPGREPEVCALVSNVAGNFMRATGTPGAAIGVVVPGDGTNVPVRLDFEFGTARPASDAGTDPATSKTVWEIGSETKLLTAMLLSEQLPASDGPISMDACGPKICMSDKVTKFLPAGVVLPAEKQNITIGMLATHTSGLPDPTPNSLDALPPGVREKCGKAGAPEECLLWRKTYTPDLLWKGLQQAELQYEPGSGYLYSDLAFAVLGQVLTNLLADSSGTSGATRAPNTTAYRSIVADRLTGPLGLVNLLPEDITDPNLAQGFRYKPSANGTPPTTAAGTEVAAAPYFENTDAFIGAGGYVSDIGDMTALTAAVLGYSPGPLTSALLRTLVPIQTCAFQGGSCAPKGKPKLQQGMAWELHSNPALTCGMHFKNGGTSGFHSATAVVSDRDYGVTALSNSPAVANPLATNIAVGLAQFYPRVGRAGC